MGLHATSSAGITGGLCLCPPALGHRPPHGPSPPEPSLLLPADLPPGDHRHLRQEEHAPRRLLHPRAQVGVPGPTPGPKLLWLVFVAASPLVASPQGWGDGPGYCRIIGREKPQRHGMCLLRLSACTSSSWGWLLRSRTCTGKWTSRVRHRAGGNGGLRGRGGGLPAPTPAVGRMWGAKTLGKLFQSLLSDADPGVGVFRTPRVGSSAGWPHSGAGRRW